AEMWALEAAIARISPVPDPLPLIDPVTAGQAATKKQTEKQAERNAAASAEVRSEPLGRRSKPRGLSANTARTARIAIIFFAVVLAVAVGCLTVGSLDVVFSENHGWILLALQQTIVAFFVIASPPLYLATVM